MPHLTDVYFFTESYSSLSAEHIPSPPKTPQYERPHTAPIISFEDRIKSDNYFMSLLFEIASLVSQAQNIKQVL